MERSIVKTVFERLLNRIQGHDEKVIKTKDGEITVLGLSKNSDDPVPVTFFRAKSSKKVHYNWGNSLSGDDTRANGWCGRTFEDVVIIKRINDEEQFWQVSSGGRAVWLQAQVPDMEFCKTCLL